MEVIRSKEVITRKPHNCWGCTEEFPKQSEMKAVTSVDGGTICTIYWCISCDNYLRIHGAELDPWNDGFVYGGLLEELEAN